MVCRLKAGWPARYSGSCLPDSPRPVHTERAPPAAAVVQTAAHTPVPPGRSLSPGAAAPTQFRKGGGASRSVVPARRAPVVRPSAAPRGARTRPSRRGGHLGTRAGALTCHRRPPSLSGGALPPPIATLCSLPLLILAGGSNGGSGGGDAFSESGPTARAARPPRPLPPAPAHRPLPPAGRKYRLFQPQTGTDVRRPRAWPQKTSDRKRRDEEEAGSQQRACVHLKQRPSWGF